MEIDQVSTAPTHSKYYGLTKKQKKALQKAGSAENFQMQQQQIKRKREENKENKQITKKQKVIETLTEIPKPEKQLMIQINKNFKELNKEKRKPKKYSVISGKNSNYLIFFVE